MADFEEKVTISVTGADSLARAGTEAEAAAKAVQKLRDDLAELGGAGAGADAAGASMGHIRDDALEAAAAVEALKRAEAGAGSSPGGSGGLSRDLISAAEAAKNIDKRLGGGSGQTFAGGGLSRIGRDAGDAERGLRDVERAAGDVEGALGGGEGAAGGAGGLAGGVEGLTGAFGKLQILAMPTLFGAIGAAAATAGPALLASATGIGAWAALAAPALMKVKDGLSDVTTAQAAYQQAVAVYKQDPTAANAKAEKSALDQLRATWAQLPAGVAKGVSAIQQAEHAFSQAGKPIQAQALKDIPKVAKDFQGLVPAVKQLASAGGPAVSGLLADFGKFEKSSGFKSFISNIKSEVPGSTKALENLASAGGTLVNDLFSKKNVGVGDSLINNVSALLKSSAPGLVHEGSQGGRILSGLARTLTDWQKPGGMLQQDGRKWDDIWTGARNATNWGRTGTKAVTDFGGPFIKDLGQQLGGGHLLGGWATAFKQAFGNMKVPVPTKTIAAAQQQGARALEQGGTPGKTPFGKGPTEKVKVDESGALAELRALSKFKMQDAKVKISVTGADTAKSDLKSVSTAAQQAGRTKTDLRIQVSGAQSAVTGLRQIGTAGSAMASGVASSAGKASASTTAMAGSMKGAVAPLPGDFQAAGAQAGAGMAAGIASETGAVSAAAAGLAAAAEASAKTSLQIQSPSKKFKTIGQQTWQGFVLGLEGGQSQVDAAIKALTGKAPFRDAKITDTVKAIRKEIDLAAKDQKINPLQKMGLTQLLDQDNQRLMTLANKRQTIINKINAAEALAKSVQQAAAQGADLGTIAGTTIQGQQDASAASGAGNIADVPTGPATLQEGLQDQLGDIQKFNSQMKQLKKEGLDKAGLKELANDGVQAGSEAASQILAGGKKGVQAIAQLDNSIGLASKKLGVTAGNAAYEGASQIGGQLAAGLKDSLKAVDKQMASLDKSLMTAIMTALGDTPKEIRAAMAKLDKELGVAGGGATSGGGGKGKITAPHEIFHPKPTQGPFAQPGPIRANPPHMVQPAVAGAFGSAAQPISITLTSNISVSGRQLAKVVQTKTLQRASSNVSNGLSLPGRTS